MDLMKNIRWGRVVSYAALMSLGFLVAFGLLGIIGPVTFGKDAPAWVQAVGSIVAILIAILVPYLQRRADTRDRKDHERLVARSLGTVLLRDFVKFRKRIERDLRIAAGTGNQTMVEISLDTIPQEVWDNTERLHLLGEPGRDVLRAMNSVQRAREELYRGTLSPTDGAATRFIERMNSAKEKCDAAISKMKEELRN